MYIIWSYLSFFYVQRTYISNIYNTEYLSVYLCLSTNIYTKHLYEYDFGLHLPSTIW